MVLTPYVDPGAVKSIFCLLPIGIPRHNVPDSSSILTDYVYRATGVYLGVRVQGL